MDPELTLLGVFRFFLSSSGYFVDFYGDFANRWLSLGKLVLFLFASLAVKESSFLDAYLLSSSCYANDVS